MKKAIVILALIMAFLLCSCTIILPDKHANENVPDIIENTEPPVDARKLWRDADKLSDDYDSVDSDISTTIELTLLDTEYSEHTDMRVKGSELRSENPKYMILHTGDRRDEMYLNDGYAYVSADFGEYKTKMSKEQFEEYISADTLPCREEYFEEVSLLSSDGGYQIAFTKPTEAYRECFISMIDDDSTLQSLDLTGKIILDSDGYIVDTEIIADAVIAVINIDAFDDFSVHMESKTKLLSHDEPVNITLPAKLDDFVKVDDITVPKLIYDAFTLLASSPCGEYSEMISFNGDVLGTSLDLSRNANESFDYDSQSKTLAYNGQFALEYKAGWQKAKDGYKAFYEDGQLSYEYDNGKKKKENADAQTVLTSAYGNITYLLTSDLINDYSVYDKQEKNDEIVIKFVPSSKLIHALYYYAIASYDSNKAIEVYDANDLKYTEAYGVMKLDAKTNELVSLSCTMTAEFRYSDGKTISGKCTYDKSFALPELEEN